MMSKTKGNQNSSKSAYDQQNGVREGLDLDLELELDFQENSKVGKTYLIVNKKLKSFFARAKNAYSYWFTTAYPLSNSIFCFSNKVRSA